MCTSQKSLIINYIPQDFTDSQLSSLFSSVGPLVSCDIMKDHNTGYSYGYGFVNFVRPKDAENAIKRLNGLQIGTKRIKVSFSRPSSDQIQNTNLYITNVPRHYTEDKLEKIFEKFGKIIQKNLLKDKVTGVPRGIAFIRFDKRDEAEKAIAEMDGMVLEDGDGDALKVRVAEDRRKKKAAFYLALQGKVKSDTKGGNPPFPPGYVFYNNNVPQHMLYY